MDRLTKKFRMAKRIKLLQLAFLAICCLLFIYVCITKTAVLKTMLADRSFFIIFLTFWILLLVMLVSNIMDFTFYRYYALAEHQLKRFLYLDKLTGIPDRKSLDEMTKTLQSPNKVATIGCFLFTLSNLTVLNAKLGRDGGNKALMDFSRLLERVGDSLGIVGRNGGNEFVCLVENCSEETAKLLISRLEAAVKQARSLSDSVDFELSYAFTLNVNAGISSYSELFATTHNKLFSKTDETLDRGTL